MKEILLGKYETAFMNIAGKKYLFCGTNLAFDEWIENSLLTTFENMAERVGVKEIDYDKYLDAIKYITEFMIKTFEENENVNVIYQYEEY